MADLEWRIVDDEGAPVDIGDYWPIYEHEDEARQVLADMIADRGGYEDRHGPGVHLQVREVAPWSPAEAHSPERGDRRG